MLAVAATAGSTPAPASARADWGTFGYTAGRVGYNPSEHTLSPFNVGSLKQVWSTYLGGVNTQPLVATGVRLNAIQTADLVYAGTEGGHFATLDAADGAKLDPETNGEDP